MKHEAGLFCDGNLRKRFFCVTAPAFSGIQRRR